jgi:hypothetical protein
MYKVFQVGKVRWRVYWVTDPDTETPPLQSGDFTYAKAYTKRQAAYYRCKQLNDRLKKEKQPMNYNSEEDAYNGVTSDGRTIRVEGIEYLENQQDGVDEETLNDPDVWAGFAGDNQNVEYVNE